MKKASSCLMALVFLLASQTLTGQESEPQEPAPRHRIINLSLYYPVSMNSSKRDTASLSLSICYSHLGSVRGIDLSLGASGLEDSLEGIQVAGLVAAAGESMKGWQTAGLICAAGEQGEGIQVAGLGSVSGGKFSGIQVAGLFSVAGEQLKGAQIGGLFSVAGENLKGVQISGLFNVAERLTGLQVGLVNVARDLSGVPVGLVNLTRKEDRRIRLAAWAGDTSLLNAGAKIWAKRFYSILYAGAVNLTQEARKCLAYGFQYGYGVPVRSTVGGSGRKMRIDVDAGYLYLDNSTLFRHLKGTPDRHVLSLRGAWAVEISPDVTVLAGTGLRYTVDYGTDFGDGAVSPVFFAGVELF